MTEYEKLLRHLVNLKKKNVKTATLDIDWLLGVLKGGKRTTTVVPEPTQPDKVVAIEVDGGTFDKDNA